MANEWGRKLVKFLQPVRHALLSVSDKTGLLEFAGELHGRSINVLSTGGSATLLKEAGIPVQEVGDHTGFSEILDGRVKTLHPLIHGGILARRGQDEAVMLKHGITPIDLVVVNLYPFESAVSEPDCQLSQAMENVDVGGPAMIRAAAKNHVHVTVVVDPNDYDLVLECMTANQGAVDEKTRFSLALKAFEHTARHDDAIANFLGRFDGAGNTGPGNEFPHTMNVQWYRHQGMRYGENPHQKAAFYVERNTPPGSVSSASQLLGKAMSYNNIADTDTALQCVQQFDESPACAIVKHNNPCGVATQKNLLQAYKKAFATDPESAFGGVIAFNRELDEATAEQILAQQFVEVIVAPNISDKALQTLTRKKNVRVLACGEWSEHSATLEFKQVAGGILVQEADCKLAEGMTVFSKRKPDAREMNDLQFAWRVAWMVKSNAVVYAKDGMTVGIGSGQTSRVNSARMATIRAELAGLEVAGAVMASDAFLPFRDGLDLAATEGITAVIQPGGSRRDCEVIAAANEHKIAMVFTGTRHFRH